MDILFLVLWLIIVVFLIKYITYRLAWRHGWKLSRVWEIGDTVAIPFKEYNTSYKMLYKIAAIEPEFIRFEREFRGTTYIEIKYYNQLHGIKIVESVE